MKYKTEDEIGHGTFNTVHKYGENAVIRVSNKFMCPEDALYAGNTYHTMSLLEVGPKIYELHYTSNNRLVIIMERFDNNCYQLDNHIRQNYKQEITEQVRKMIKTMSDIELLFIDIKPGNLLYKISNDKIILRFTDFDKAHCHFYCSLPDEFKSIVPNNDTRKKLLKNIMTLIFCLTPSSSYLHFDLNLINDNDVKLLVDAVNNYKD